ncbi:tripartite tricarboxylate transporter substrate binding protein (plasmid) [Rhizobium ruizarguesonis]|jgi:tripartite-type tricarboxylate transporter receptor subunit TctC|uniref:Tripartite tricarboxylate transporter substrate binding protein n=1 Tax=Rhizobium ruizarguesonis TaxID=2081791 RepID=A0AAE4YPQ4_9HYPH|nr:tripartite tricarboxylate transporter substrate binding protein [Rhizobium ruizarguesonis]NKK54406.1 tripartite tricarboxylate transporter substrate binding protein [Rhizobium leguminosarum bv. viciae]QIJ43885.1 tripartite tricarboxylate transporter substrate binding protein [Rhizobium leguminosarum]QJS31021.1 tripartite tricarboxylate transporter substrate binding protein [Rhizobium leguminosarum bv. trifolii TA1]MCB2404645.1 tripartite tricarboxylate transporter substrate binding protein [
MITRRNVLLGTTAAISAGLLTRVSDARAAEWPVRPITINIGNAPGGDDDTLSRFLAQTASEELGQPVVIENRAGGSTTVAGNAVAGAKPDGYNILCLITAGLVQTVLRDNLQYGLDDFVPIVEIGGYPLALIVSAKAGITSIDELMAVAKSPDGVTFASGGVGTVGHLTSTMFLKEAGGKGVHVSYKNNPEGIQALAGGFTQMIFASAREAALLKDDPNVRVLAVTSPARTTNLPNVPTTAEIGYPQVNSRVWYSYAAPKGVPDEVVTKFSAAIVKGVKDPKFQERFTPLSFQTDIKTGDELTAFLKAEQDKFRKVITENNIRLNN